MFGELREEIRELPLPIPPGVLKLLKEDSSTKKPLAMSGFFVFRAASGGFALYKTTGIIYTRSTLIP